MTEPQYTVEEIQNENGHPDYGVYKDNVLLVWYKDRNKAEYHMSRIDNRAAIKANKMLTDRLEDLAALEHNQWMLWAQSLMDNEVLSVERVERWKSLMVPYSELSEDMKEHDRVWARQVISIFQEYM